MSLHFSILIIQWKAFIFVDPWIDIHNVLLIDAVWAPILLYCQRKTVRDYYFVCQCLFKNVPSTLLIKRAEEIVSGYLIYFEP